MAKRFKRSQNLLEKMVGGNDVLFFFLPVAVSCEFGICSNDDKKKSPERWLFLCAKVGMFEEVAGSRPVV